MTERRARNAVDEATHDGNAAPPTQSRTGCSFEEAAPDLQVKVVGGKIYVRKGRGS
jgi:hypothetical protein